MAERIAQVVAGRARSFAITDEGAALGWGSMRLLRLGDMVAPEAAAALCEAPDPSRVGHDRFALARPTRLKPHTPVRAIADGTADFLMVTQTRQVHACRPVFAADEGARSVCLARPASVNQVAMSDCGGFAVDAEGGLWSWGLNAQGQMGRDAPELSDRPGRVDGIGPVRALAAGANHVLALDAQGRVWSWGANSAGQLGVGDLQARARPVRVPIPMAVERISAGATHSLALDRAGGLWAWGSNHKGQLALDDDGYRAKPVTVRLPFRPRHIAAGMHYSLATERGGAVHAWGWNGLAQLARDGLDASARPLRVPGLEEVRQISAGTTHALAVCGDHIRAWGDNRQATCAAPASVRAVTAPRRVEWI